MCLSVLRVLPVLRILSVLLEFTETLGLWSLGTLGTPVSQDNGTNMKCRHCVCVPTNPVSLFVLVKVIVPIITCDATVKSRQIPCPCQPCPQVGFETFALRQAFFFTDFR